MSLLFDENLSRNVARRLAGLFPGVVHVADLGMLSASDAALWAAERSRGLAIVSKDSHFQGMSFVRGHPPKVIWLRVGTWSSSRIERLIRDNATVILEFLEDAKASVLVLPAAVPGSGAAP